MNNLSTKTNVIERSRDRYSLVLGPMLTLVIGGFISILIFLQIQSWEKSKIQSSFEFNSQLRLASLQTDIVRHKEVVNSIAGLFSSSKNVTRKEFKSFVNEILSRYPYITGLSWNPLIKRSEKNKFTAKAHKDGIYNFEITELDSNGNIIKSPAKDEYVSVFYIEPYLGNEKAMGFDIASNPARMKAIIQARDTGDHVITERIKLVQEKEKNYGYLLLKAIYQKGSVVDTVSQRRENFTGLAVGVFRFRDWIPLTMKGVEPLGIDILITDESAPADKQFLHFHSSRTRKEIFQPTYQDYTNAKKGLYWQKNIDILGRQWSFLFTPSPSFLHKHNSYQSWISLIVGLFITLLVTLYIFNNAKHAAKLTKTNNDLKNALYEIKTLQGIIPICSYCHSIRDDEGAWSKVESYISKHSDAKFSHGICPKCEPKARSDAGLDNNED